MADNQPNSVHKNSEEIDLRELLRLLSRGMQGIGNSVLRTFIFFKKNITYKQRYKFSILFVFFYININDPQAPAMFSV